MKSSIKIDLGPSIKVRLIPTEDVRDRLFKQFFEELNYSSNLAYIKFEGHSIENGQVVQDISIYPIGAEEGTTYAFTEKTYFERGEICPAQCRRLIPLCYKQLDPIQAEEAIKELLELQKASEIIDNGTNS